MRLEWRSLAAAAVVITMAAWFVSGMVRFPDAPIHKCSPTAPYLYPDHPSGWCGKQGQPRTEIDFHDFKFWETGLLLIWPAGMLALFLLKRKR